MDPPDGPVAVPGLHYVKLAYLPFDTTEEEIILFLTPYLQQPDQVQPDQVVIMTCDKGRHPPKWQGKPLTRSGIAYVGLPSKSEQLRALDSDQDYMGKRIVEVSLPSQMDISRNFTAERGRRKMAADAEG